MNRLLTAFIVLLLVLVMVAPSVATPDDDPVQWAAIRAQASGLR